MPIAEKMESVGSPKSLPVSVQRADRGEERDREVASIALAFLFAAGATLGLAALILPHNAPMNEVGVATICLSALPVATLLLTLKPLPWPVLHPTLALGTLMVTGAAEFSHVIVGGYTFFYLWVVLFAAYFFDRRGTLLHLGVVAFAYAGLVALSQSPAEWGLGWLVTIGALTVAAVLVRGLKEYVDRLVAQLSRAATTDDLSGLLNRRGFNQHLTEELLRAGRSGRGLALVVGDLDHFKEVNDQYGHPAGDEALRRVSALLHDTARASDTVARIGGEEFALVLPYTSRPGAQAMAERIRQRVREAFSSEGMTLTISFGISVYPDDGDTHDLLMRAADAALYAAKTLGRDRTESSDPKRKAAKPTGTDGDNVVEIRPGS